MNIPEFNDGFIDFLKASPTPFHAVAVMAARLEQNGFTRLHEADAWTLTPGGKYYVTRNDSSLIAFVFGKEDRTAGGIRMVGAHTDSPCLKVKPQPEQVNHTCCQLAVEVYGGPLFNPWFDRDLSLAGRVTYLTNSEELESALIDFERPVAVIPSLAIHLDREANKNRSINPQTDLNAVLMQTPEEEDAGKKEKGRGYSFRDLLLNQLRREHPDARAASVVDFEICLYDVQPPAFVGINREFITGARLDNLFSCYIGMMALLEAGEEKTAMLICNDHEEIGSTTATGAHGPFFRSVLERVCPSAEERSRTIDRSMLISADDAHGLHPNFADRHDPGHLTLLNRGPVIKVSASQKYSSNSETMAMFRRLCEKMTVPVQDFVMRNDMPGGSTIGSITAAQIGVKTLDVGVPIWAMHSIRETAGVQDGFSLYKVFGGFFRGE